MLPPQKSFIVLLVTVIALFLGVRMCAMYFLYYVAGLSFAESFPSLLSDIIAFIVTAALIEDLRR